MLIVKYRKIFFILTGLIVATAIFSVAFFGLNFGIDFTGGAITEVSYPEIVLEEENINTRPSKESLEERLQGLDIGGFSIRPTGEDGYILRTQDLTEEKRVEILNILSLGGEKQIIQERFNSIGPTIGSELRNKAFVAIGIVVVAIILFVAFVFRKVSQPVSSWKYGIVAIIALIHDVLVPVGIFAFLGYTVGAEIDILFVMALLAILGYSVNDTIVVFDRVRENLRLNREHGSKEDFELTVGKSLNQTYARSINTSLTTLFVLIALFFIGSEATQDFALVLATGVIAGTYSSIFLATPLLVVIGKRASKN